MTPNWLGEPFAFKDNKLSLTRKVHKRLLAEAQEAFPYEYSALLIGQKAAITDHIPMTGSTLDKHAFSFDGPGFLRAIALIRESNMQWLGVLHTHPHTLPVPSQRDRDGWHYHSLSYWIVSLCGSEPLWRMYQWQDGDFQQRSYTITEEE
ncbi:Mov34/MPN/PAD-1 family protein [Brevibacillus choshinensis]|uniref:M67 family metallopeptidase n=1 Tax=Brevibacillus choshinensis TaxID=54911 RepID=A0ABX7FPI0_BRECH|nr:M67 family metallopeptidase [Brevibacillus choshinensis]QRG66895.1 M67 family metallopeptidase [Brevibacillus choshinensis]